MMIDSSLLRHKAVLILPHCIDAVFLLSGFTMAFMVNFKLFNQPWLSLKILLLMVYLFLVGVCLSRGHTKKIRVSAFLMALLTFGYIVGIAINKTPASWFG